MDPVLPSLDPDPAVRQEPTERDADEDRRFVLHDISWEQYESMRELLDEHSSLRITYLEGTLELMSPSRTHEHIKKLIARLVELYAIERDIDLNGYGNMTFKRKARKRGLEPDECYTIGVMSEETGAERPDIAFEVEVSRSAIDKLDVYAGLGVPELWFWRGEKMQVHRLGPDGYQPRDRSDFIPGLDFSLLAQFVGIRNQAEAVKAFREALRAAGR